MARLEARLHPDWNRASPGLVLVSLILALPLTFMAHEAVHGLVFRAFGGRPRFGAGFTWGLPYLYAACPGQAFLRNRFLAVGVAPLLVLDAAGLLLMLPGPTAFFGAALAVLNTSGAIGDLWFVAVLLQAPGWVSIEDVGPSFVAWAPPERAEGAARLRPPVGLDAPGGQWFWVWFLTSLGLLILSAPFFGLLTRSTGRLQIGPLLLASHVGRRVFLNLPGWLLLAGLAGAVLVSALALLRLAWRRFSR